MQIQTERGLIAVCDMFTSKEQMMKADNYTYTFHSEKLNCDCYSIMIDATHREFALLYERELTFSESLLYQELGEKDNISVPYIKNFRLESGMVYNNIGKYIVHTNSQGKDSIYAIRDVCGDVLLDRIYNCKTNISLCHKGRFHILDKSDVNKLLEDRGITVDKLESINKYNKKQRAILRDL